MSKRMMTIFAGLILVCGILLAAGVSLTGGVVRVIAARVPGASVGELKVNIKEWDVPTKGAHTHDPAVAPHGLVADASGSIWFTGNGKGYIGKLDPKSGDVKVYQMPDEKAEDPHTAVFDSRGILWFTVQVGNMVGRLDPQSGKLDLKAVQGQRAL